MTGHSEIYADIDRAFNRIKRIESRISNLESKLDTKEKSDFHYRHKDEELCEHGGDSESCELCEDQRWQDAALGSL